MNEKQRVAINKKLDKMRLTPRRKTSWGKGFSVSKKKTDIEMVEALRFERMAVTKEKLWQR